MLTISNSSFQWCLMFEPEHSKLTSTASETPLTVMVCAGLNAAIHTRRCLVLQVHSEIRAQVTTDAAQNSFCSDYNGMQRQQ